MTLDRVHDIASLSACECIEPRPSGLNLVPPVQVLLLVQAINHSVEVQNCLKFVALYRNAAVHAVPKASFEFPWQTSRTRW
jgi:hypothetical protein